MSSHRTRFLSMTTAVICLLGLVACSGGDDGDPESTTSEPASTEGTAEAPPRLEEEWSSPAKTLAGVDTVRMTPDVLALTSRQNLRGLDRRTGDKRWTMKPPGDLNQICFTSEQVSPDGIVGVLMAGRGRDCTVAGAVDLASGELLWTRTMPSAPPYHSGRGVTVGDRTLTAEMFCDEVRRFSLKDGKPLRTLAPRDHACAMESASNGQQIAVLNDPATPRTPDDHGTGWIPAVEGSVGLELYDADSGRLLWRRTVSNSDANVDDVVSAEPTILTRTLRAHKLTQIYGPDGEPGPYLGLQLTPFGAETLEVLGHLDGLLVATYPDADAFRGAQMVYGYSDRTGEERWRLPVPTGWLPIGVRGDGLLMAGTGHTEGSPEQWLTSYDLDDPTEVQTLGSVAGTGVLAADDTTVYAADGEEITAYSLPEIGTEGAPELTGPLDPEWAEHDVRPEDVAGACDAITPETLTRLGFRSPRLPTPVDCHFAEHAEPEYLDRELAVLVQAFPPGMTAGGEVSATEAAEAAAVEAAGSLSPTPADRVLGDQSWSSFDTGEKGWVGSVVARWRNVIVTVTATQDVILEDRGSWSVPVGELPGIARDAAGQVLESIGAPAAEAEPGADGPATRVPDVCRLLAGTSTELVPDVPRTVTTPRAQTQRREAGCYWFDEREGTPDLLAQVYAVPGSEADGSTGTEMAKLIYGGESHPDSRRVRRLGDEARVHTFGFGSTQTRHVLIGARQGNTVARVRYSRWDEGMSREEMIRRTTDVVRTLLASAR